MIVLSKNDTYKCVSPSEIIQSVENALMIQESGNFLMPDRMHINSNENVLLLMPAFGSDYFSTKLVSVFPGNSKLNQPVIYGTVILNDGTTGQPLALINGSALTAMRTGAIGALGIKYTSHEKATKLGLIGAGHQGYHQLIYACEVRNIKHVSIYDPYNKQLDLFVRELTGVLPHIHFTIEKNVLDLVEKSEIITTATTSNTPVIDGPPDLFEGKHFIGLGSYRPYMHELPESLLPCLTEIIVDTDHAKQESGDLSIPLESGKFSEDKIFRLGEVINHKKQIDTSRTTFFKTVGMALFDLCSAQTIYDNASKNKIGTKIDF